LRPGNIGVLNYDLRYDEIQGADPNLTSLDVYSTGTSSLSPVIIYFHGGGWKRGDKTRLGLMAPCFLNNGYVFVSANYRLSPAFMFPSYLEDVAKAVAWVRVNVESYGGKPDRLYLMGSSAGAHLVSLVATDESYLQREGLLPRDISGVVSLDTRAYDIPSVMRSLPKEGAVYATYTNTLGTNPSTWERASPCEYLDKGRDIPPFFIAYTCKDPLRKTWSEGFAQDLKKIGVQAELLPVPDKDHGRLTREFGTKNDPVSEAVLRFLSRLEDAHNHR
jgi:acetyl esterase/lipase